MRGPFCIGRFQPLLRNCIFPRAAKRQPKHRLQQNRLTWPVMRPLRVDAAMTIVRPAVFRATVAADVLFQTTSAASAAEVNRVEARFEIFGFAGLHVLTNRTTVEESKDRYSIAMDLDTRGLARVFVDLTSHSEVHGRLGTNTARPEAYRAEVRRNGNDRHYAVDYSGDGAINASVAPDVGKPVLSSAEQIRGTVDQLTAY